MTSWSQQLKQCSRRNFQFQDVSLGHTLAFDIQPGEFIQIIHDGHGHWLTISTIGASKNVVHIYDSLLPSIGSNTKAQIASILACEDNQIDILYIIMMDVQCQEGTCDCGLFAVAFATALANGIEPGKLKFKHEESPVQVFQQG